MDKSTTAKASKDDFIANVIMTRRTYEGVTESFKYETGFNERSPMDAYNRAIAMGLDHFEKSTNLQKPFDQFFDIKLTVTLRHPRRH